MSSLAREKQRVIMRERSHRSNITMKPFVRGDLVWIQDPESKFWDLKGRILAVRPSGMSYHVQKENGKVSRRNRKFLKMREAVETDEEIDLEAAGIMVVEAPFPCSIQRKRQSCLRRPAVGAATWRQSTCRGRKQVSFVSATWLEEVPECEGAPVSIHTSIRLAQRVTRFFKPSMTRG
jgi:hypothetical protein